MYTALLCAHLFYALGKEISPYVSIAQIGESTQFTCYSKTVPEWRRNETKLFEYTVIVEHTGSKEVIQLDNLQDWQSDIYHCYGQDNTPFRASAHLFVGIADRGRIERNSLFTAELGSTLKLSCRSPFEDRIRWYFQRYEDIEKYLIGAGKFLIVPRLDYNEAGDFICYGPLDEDNYFMDKVSLIVYDSSIVLPNELTVNEGERITLECNSQKWAVWSFNNRRLPKALVDNENSLTITRANSQHEGIYTCEGEDNMDRKIVGAATVIVIDKSKFGIIPTTQLAYVGSYVILTCYSRTKPKWRNHKGNAFNHVVIKEHDSFSEIIKIENLLESDSGLYRCKGKSKKRFVASSNLFVGVPEDGHITTEYSKENSNIITVIEDSKLNLHCRAYADDVKWFKNTSPVNRKQMKLLTTDPNITINNVKKSMSGAYYCYGQRRDFTPFIDDIHIIVKDRKYISNGSSTMIRKSQTTRSSTYIKRKRLGI